MSTRGFKLHRAYWAARGRAAGDGAKGAPGGRFPGSKKMGWRPHTARRPHVRYFLNRLHWRPEPAPMLPQSVLGWTGAPPVGAPVLFAVATLYEVKADRL